MRHTTLNRAMAPTFQRLDMVQLRDGSQMIVVDVIPTRPANPYLGVKPNGNGAKYKFGPKHAPTKIGSVSETHPALVAMAQREGGPSPQAKEVLSRLLNAVDVGDMKAAQTLAHTVRAFYNLES